MWRQNKRKIKYKAGILRHSVHPSFWYLSSCDCLQDKTKIITVLCFSCTTIIQSYTQLEAARADELWSVRLSLGLCFMLAFLQHTTKLALRALYMLWHLRHTCNQRWWLRVKWNAEIISKLFQCFISHLHNNVWN